METPLPGHAEFIVRLLLFAALHSLFATRRAKQLLGGTGGTEPRCYRLAYNIASLAVFGWAMAAGRQSPLLYSIKEVWRWLFYTGQAACAVAILSCVRQTGAGDFLGTARFHHPSPQQHRLVTDGWYAHVRHPLYLLSMLFLILNPDMSVSWALLTLYSLLYFIAGALIEEHRLQIDFGKEYRDYQTRVPFLIPSPRTFRAAGDAG